MKHIEGNYYLDNDSLQFILKEDTGTTSVDNKTGEKKKVYKVHGFYRHPEQAIEKYINLKVASSSAKNVAELAQEIRELKAFFRKQFQEENKCIK